jgi:hypothetical protein
MQLKNYYWLHVGDVIAISLVTIIGFASHGSLDTAGLRLLTTYIPLLVAWYLISPFLGVFQRDVAADWHKLWKPGLAMIYAAPFAAWLRAILLDTTTSWVFILVLAAVSAAGIILWRGLYWFIVFRG